MTRLRRSLSSLRDTVTAPYRTLRDWWSDIPAEGQVAFVGLVLMGVGLNDLSHVIYGLVVPGAVLTAIGMGFNLKRSR